MNSYDDYKDYDDYPDHEECTSLLSRYDPEVLSLFQSEMSQGIERFFLISYCLACCWPALGAKSELRIVRQWAELEFEFPSRNEMMKALEKRYYVPGKSVALDVDVHHMMGKPSRIFVTIPRFDEGRPMTLSTVNNEGKLVAYPDYSWHDNQGSNCDGLTSVYRVAIDECQRLWVMDSGKIGDNQVCPPKLLAFDLKTNQVIYQHIVDKSSYITASLFINVVVDIRSQSHGDCSDTFVYVADVSAYGILVVDVLRNKSWRLTHRLFYPYPNRGTFTIDNESFDLMDGVFGMALSPYRPGNERYLYFHALAATTENVISTNILRNDSYAEHPELGINDIYTYPKERTSQSAAEAMDRNGIMYFGHMNPPKIMCWNTATEYAPHNHKDIANDKETLQFASGVKIVTNAQNLQELWVLTSSFQRVMTGTLSSNRTNFRILAENLSSLQDKCRLRQNMGGSYGRR